MRLATSLFGLFLCACGNQFEATYELDGAAWRFDAFEFSTGGCSDEFLAELEAGVETSGSFPEFGTAATEPGTVTVAGHTIDLDIEAADENNPAKGRPVEPDAVYAAGDGTEFSLDTVSFETKRMCAVCEDQIKVKLFSTATCAPQAVYLLDR